MAGALRHGAIPQCQDAAPRAQKGKGGCAHHRADDLEGLFHLDDSMVLYTKVTSTGRMELGWTDQSG